jgi:hypothetical protein
MFMLTLRLGALIASLSKHGDHDVSAHHNNGKVQALAALSVAALALATSCSSASDAPHVSTARACAVSRYSGPRILVLLQNSTASTKTLSVGQEIVVPKRPNPGAALLARPEMVDGAFCERAQDASNWYLIASRPGTFTLTSSFQTTCGNCNQGYEFANVKVR